MKKLMTTLFFTTLCTISFSQKAPLKFGDVSIEDLKMTKYEKDTSAAAVVLADYGVSSIRYDDSYGWFKVYFERTTRIKILKKEGYSFADFEVPYYHTSDVKEKISSLKVITHNLENGKDVETKMKSDAVFEQKYDNNIDIQKFTAPNVKVGSIIEVTYKITSEFLSNFRDWEFQSTIPVVWSEYRVEIPEYFNYERYTQGYITLVVNESDQRPQSLVINTKERGEGPTLRGPGTTTTFTQDKINYSENYFRWAAKDVPAFVDEPFMTTKSDYISKINFELANYRIPNGPIKQIMGTWDDLNRSFLESEYFGLAVKGSGFLKKITDDVTAGLSTPQEKVAAIYTYVKSNVAWDGGYRRFIDESLKKTLDEKKGSSAEINLMLVSMLQKADLVANPVILSTRDNGFVRENVAVSSQFNYVICQVLFDGKSMLLDATEKMLPMNLLPERCLNGNGYIISKETSGWIALTSPKSKVYATSDVAFSKDGQLAGNMKIYRDGYFGHKMRNEYGKKGEEEYVKDFSHQMSWTVDKSEFKNLKELSAGAEENHVFTHNDNFGNSDIIYLNPLLYLRINENPFKLENRTYPVDFGSATEQTFVCKLAIPENYAAEELPVSKIFALPNNAARYVYNIQAAGNLIIVTSVLSINKGLFAQNEYPNLREFYNQVIAKQAEQIVFKKK